ncbi:MAG: class I SAM-dependent methyltransferase [Deltaproteobacteria bacterium]|nr:MAG: class I SAM-dependent methyltransferase [Deltaproteobacteria bacterium]
MLSRGLEELAIGPRDRREPLAARLAMLTELLRRWNEQINLTAHRTLDAIARRLILDAAALSQILPEFESLADLGSGPGLPGLPLALLRPHCRVTLVEARERPHHFQRAAVRELGLSNVSLRLGRAESLQPELHAAVIAQAVAQPNRVLRWMLPWVEPGGCMFIPAGPQPPELPGIERVEPLPPVEYRVPCGGPVRSVWMGRRSLQ